MLVSKLPLARYSPSGEKHNAVIGSLCENSSFNIFYKSYPFVFISIIRISLSIIEPTAKY